MLKAEPTLVLDLTINSSHERNRSTHSIKFYYTFPARMRREGNLKTIEMIRAYKNTDLESILTIWYEAQTLAHPFLSKEFVDKVKVMMKDLFIPNSKTWVYEVDGEVIGFIAMMNNEIGGLFVDPNKQSKGIGTLLVNFVKPKYDNLEVEVFKNNVIGTSFYRKYGFEFMRSYLHEETGEIVNRLETKKQ